MYLNSLSLILFSLASVCGGLGDSVKNGGWGMKGMDEGVKILFGGPEVQDPFVFQGLKKLQVLLWMYLRYER
jgi:hypothetical protein